jgi:hypothetical protein
MTDNRPDFIALEMLSEEGQKVFAQLPDEDYALLAQAIGGFCGVMIAASVRTTVNLFSEKISSYVDKTMEEFTEFFNPTNPLTRQESDAATTPDQDPNRGSNPEGTDVADQPPATKPEDDSLA